MSPKKKARLIANLTDARQSIIEGKLDRAETICLKILNAYSNQPDAFHFLGLVHSQRGNQLSAIKYFKKAIQQHSGMAEYHHHLAEVQGTKHHCTRVANQYLADNYLKVDPLWREHERYQQYRICMAETKQPSF